MPINGSIEHQFIFEKDDIPNNKILPLILYKGVADFEDKEPESVFEAVFTRNNWGNGWRSGHPDGIFSFHHYHSDAHEVVGIARGSATRAGSSSRADGRAWPSWCCSATAAA